MNNTFHKIDVAAWARREEFEFFTHSGCGFAMTADLDITGFCAFAKRHESKLYPVLVAAAIRIVNAHREFRLGWDGGSGIGYYDVVHPLFFDSTPDGSPKSLYCAYKNDLLEQVAEIEKVRAEYEGIDGYSPQGEKPANLINISCVPWVKFTGLSFCMQYCATYYAPIITFGKFEKKDGGTVIPLSVYCNHAVNDGYHCSLLFSELQALSDTLE